MSLECPGWCLSVKAVAGRLHSLGDSQSCPGEGEHGASGCLL